MMGMPPGVSTGPDMGGGMPPGMSDMGGGMPPGMPGAEGQDVGPEARAKLQQMLEQLQTKRGEFNAMQFSNKNASEGARQDALMQVFEIMQKNGIDPSNVEEVKGFLDQLEQSNPELFQLFVEAFEQLMGGGAPMSPEDQGAIPPIPNEPAAPGDLSGALAPAGPSMPPAPGGQPMPPAPGGGIAGQFPGLAQ